MYKTYYHFMYEPMHLDILEVSKTNPLHILRDSYVCVMILNKILCMGVILKVLPLLNFTCAL